MQRTRRIEFVTGPVGHGMSAFTARLGGESWSCHASYIDLHPLHNLILSAVDLYSHIFVEPVPTGKAVWDSTATDEPGGIIVRAVPNGDMVETKVFLYSELFPIPCVRPGAVPVGQAIVSYWEYADAVFADAARSVARHGLTGFRQAWDPNRWCMDAHDQVLPIEHFLFLAALVRNRKPVPGMTLDQEVDLLDWVRREARSRESAGLDTPPPAADR